MKYLTLIITFAFLILVLIIIMLNRSNNNPLSRGDLRRTWWNVQSIDSVKYSRDVAREKAEDDSYDTVIEDHVSAIASTGATHIAIGTPYNEEFVPFMKRWINMARKYKLNVWFRGNAAGWEGWFGYPWLTREDHTKEIEKFILSNGDLFEDGDIFSSCPECENGGDGDPRLNGDVVGHREFLIKEYGVVREAFQRIDKDVAANFNPMNGDVAQLIMDRETTKALGGIVVVDHYVGTPEQLAEDAKSYANSSGGKVVIGEFGVPIPDIHGNMTEAEQAAWLSEALKLLSEVPEVIGVNYWTSHGGSTRLWDDDGGERQAVSTLKKYFVPYVFTGVVKDETGKPITDARIQIENQVVLSNKQGEFTVKHLNKAAVAISAYGYETVPVTVNMDEIILKRTNPNIIYRVKKFLRSISISTLTGK